MDSRLASCAKIVGLAALLGSCVPPQAPVMADGTPWTIYVYVDPALAAGMADEILEQRRTASAQVGMKLIRNFEEFGFNATLLRAPEAYDGTGSLLVQATIEHHDPGKTAAQDRGNHFVGALAGADMAAAGSAMVTVSYQLLDQNLELLQTNHVAAESGRWESAVETASRQIAVEVTQAFNHSL